MPDFLLGSLRCVFSSVEHLTVVARSELPRDLDAAASAAGRGYLKRLRGDRGRRRLHHAAPPDLAHTRVRMAERLVERVLWTMGVLVLGHARVRVGTKRPRTEGRGGGRTLGENGVGDLEVEDFGLAKVATVLAGIDYVVEAGGVEQVVTPTPWRRSSPCQIQT